LFETFFS